MGEKTGWPRGARNRNLFTGKSFSNANKPLNIKEKKQVETIAKREVRKALETKHKDKPYTSLIASTTISYGSASSVNGMYGDIAEGTGENERIGLKIKTSGVKFDLEFRCGDLQNTIRILVVTARKGIRYQPTDVTNFVQNLLSNTAPSATQYGAPVDPDRFKILIDKKIHLRQVPYDGGTAAGISTTYLFREYVRMNKVLSWDLQGNITNDMYLVMLSDSGLVPNPGAVSGYVRAYYKDM